jgi:hypothetical protein
VNPANNRLSYDKVTAFVLCEQMWDPLDLARDEIQGRYQGYLSDLLNPEVNLNNSLLKNSVGTSQETLRLHYEDQSVNYAQ